MQPLIASATMPGSMTSPSTMASSTTEVNATLVRTGSPRAVRDDDELDQAAADVETDRRPLAAEQSHRCPLVGGLCKVTLSDPCATCQRYVLRAQM